jgi:glucosamine--fructose-6-phosphate aminotransferase (isomerizing)
MCGIVGFVGENKAVSRIIQGLERLEYRGYDSAGIIYKENDFVLKKEEGKIENLKSALGNLKIQSNIGIGHTRWATHGKVTKENAHPHKGKRIAAVHNGIIENFSELKEEFADQNFKYKSTTDSEVFVMLVEYYLKEKEDLVFAVSKALKKVKGNSAFVVMDLEQEKIVAVKRDAPLICGKNTINGDLMVSSDPYALVGFVNKIFFPENEILCEITPGESKIKFYDIDGNPSKKYEIKDQRVDVDVAVKGDFDHFMIKEIHDQPGVIRKACEYYVDGPGREELKKFEGLIGSQRLHIIACGTAYNAGLVIKNLVEYYNGVTTVVELASEFRYGKPLLHEGDIGLFISQSGETADTLAAQKMCKQRGLKTVSIVNVEGSTLYRECDENMLLRAGVEVCVCSTKAFTMMVAAGYLASRALMGKVEETREELLLLADRIEELLSRSEQIKQIAEKIHSKNGFLFTGRGTYFPIALEGALKLKEIAYVHAEGYASGELKHGPIALIDENMVNIAIVDPFLYDKTRSNVEEVKARRGIIVVIGPKGDKYLEELADYYIPLDFSGFKDLGPLYASVSTQVLSYYMAKFKGTDIDKPRNLAKSVTVE